MILRPFKKIKEQEERIEVLLNEINAYKSKEEDRQKKEKEGNHNVGIWCNGCENLLEKESYNFVLGKCTDRFCKLDCKCEDRKDGD